MNEITCSPGESVQKNTPKTRCLFKIGKVGKPTIFKIVFISLYKYMTKPDESTRLVEVQTKRNSRNAATFPPTIR